MNSPRVGSGRYPQESGQSAIRGPGRTPSQRGGGILVKTHVRYRCFTKLAMITSFRMGEQVSFCKQGIMAQARGGEPPPFQAGTDRPLERARTDPFERARTALWD